MASHTNLRSAMTGLSVAALALSLSLFTTPALNAQAGASNASPAAHGVPPSVTSIGFGNQGNRAPGLPPSVSSPGFPGHPPNNGTHPHPRPDHYPRGGVAYGVPYYYPYTGYDDSANAPADDSADYQGGPTIFDRRGNGSAMNTPQSDSSDYRAQANYRARTQPQPDPDPVSNQPDTVLVFKDGHQLEIANYAIVGNTLIDLTEGHRRKIALSELDLVATGKQNDDRGIDFRIPPGTAVAN